MNLNLRVTFEVTKIQGIHHFTTTMGEKSQEGIVSRQKSGRDQDRDAFLSIPSVFSEIRMNRVKSWIGSGTSELKPRLIGTSREKSGSRVKLRLSGIY